MSAYFSDPVSGEPYEWEKVRGKVAQVAFSVRLGGRTFINSINVMIPVRTGDDIDEYIDKALRVTSSEMIAEMKLRMKREILESEYRKSGIDLDLAAEIEGW